MRLYITYERADGGVLAILGEQVEIEEHPGAPPDEHDEGADDADAEGTVEDVQ